MKWEGGVCLYVRKAIPKVFTEVVFGKKIQRKLQQIIRIVGLRK